MEDLKPRLTRTMGFVISMVFILMLKNTIAVGTGKSNIRIPVNTTRTGTVSKRSMCSRTNDICKIAISNKFCTKQQMCQCFVLNSKDILADCSGMNLKDIPNFHMNVTIIDMSNNTISTLKIQERIPHTVKFLNLSQNTISRIFPDFFNNFNSLEILDLSNNKLEFRNTTFCQTVFNGLNNLKILNLKNNNDKGASFKYPDDAFSKLFSLQVLRVDGMRFAKFGPGFLKLKQLSVLDLSSKASSIVHLKSDAFQNLPNLEKLDLSFCDLHNIDNGTFRYLSKLRDLDISSNEKMTFAVFPNITYDLQFTSIRELKANKIHYTLGLGTKLFIKDIVFFRYTKIERISLDYNRLEIFEYGALSLLPNSLYYVSLAGNRLLMDLYYIEFARGTGIKILNLQMLRTSHLPSRIFPTNDLIDRFSEVQFSATQKSNYAKCSYDNSNTTNIDRKSLYLTKLPYLNYSGDLVDGTMENMTLFLPPNLEMLLFNNSNVNNVFPRLAIQRKNSFRYMDCSGSFIYNWQGPLINFFELEYLDFSNNYCTKVSPFFFRDLIKLKTLRIGNNFLGFVLNKDIRGLIFRNLRNLRYIDLSQNKIQFLPKSIFSGLRRLESLNLSDNMMREIHFSISHMKYLNHIDLSRNELSVISDDARKVLDKMWKKKNVTVYLHGNRIQCSCGTLDFLEWLFFNNVHFYQFENYTCTFDNGTKTHFHNFESILRQMQLECFPKFGLIAGVIIGIVFSISVTIGGLLYRYRWKLQYLYYISRRNNRYAVLLDNNEEEFRYDAFISYAEEQKGFIMHDMVKKLEEERGLRLCVHHRDFIPGTSIHENMANAIRNSRRTIVVLSRAFIESGFCMWEFNIAKMENIYSGRPNSHVICLIYFEKMPTKDLPLTILEHIQSQSYIEFPTKDLSDQRVEDLFWEKVTEALSAT